MANSGHIPDFNKLSGQMYDVWEQSMTRWWDEVLESPAFLKQMGQNLASQGRLRSAYEKQVDKNLEQLHLPTRQDMLRVARIASLLEDRQLQLEDRILQLQDKLVELEKEALTARVEAAEARLEMNERLAGMESKLDQLLAQSAAPAKKAPARRTRKAPAKAAAKAAAESPPKAPAKD
ncbi:MAG: poly(R)-hydroxyalkanoic acid synthase subunit PhaE [Myxococcota bacterium]|nr:poly(R)-hydroxyalkanoic acid synthase subunit PhaE [Myxococcota bacterium]